MSIITKISVQKKNKERFSIYIDKGNGEEFAFGVHQDVLIKNNLHKGMELDELEMAQIAYDDDISRAYSLAIKYLSRQMRTVFEVEQYLTEQEMDVPVIKEVLLKLKEHRFTDDEQYAEAYINTYMRTAYKGPILLKKELEQKGISQVIIENYLDKVPKEEFFDQAKLLSTKELKKYSKFSYIEKQQKLQQFLVRKGYSYEYIQEALTLIEENKYDDDEEWSALCIQANKIKKRLTPLSEYANKQKFKQNLYRKGFSIDLIEKWLQSEESEI